MKDKRPPDQKAVKRLDRERRTVHQMIRIYCHDTHHPAGVLCGECATLWVYVQERIGHCRFRFDKPTCVNCPVHCYKKSMKERIRVVMSHSGPRMLWHHPLLAFFHYWDGRRKPLQVQAAVPSRTLSASAKTPTLAKASSFAKASEDKPVEKAEDKSGSRKPASN